MIRDKRIIWLLLLCLQVAEALSIKFRAAFEAVSKITDTLEVDYSRHAFDATGLKSCCKLDESGMEYNFLFKKKVCLLLGALYV